jgi:hypothetical protein
MVRLLMWKVPTSESTEIIQFCLLEDRALSVRMLVEMTGIKRETVRKMLSLGCRKRVLVSSARLCIRAFFGRCLLVAGEMSYPTPHTLLIQGRLTFRVSQFKNCNERDEIRGCSDDPTEN